MAELPPPCEGRLTADKKGPIPLPDDDDSRRTCSSRLTHYSSLSRLRPSENGHDGVEYDHGKVALQIAMEMTLIDDDDDRSTYLSLSDIIINSISHLPLTTSKSTPRQPRLYI